MIIGTIIINKPIIMKIATIIATKRWICKFLVWKSIIGSINNLTKSAKINGIIIGRVKYNANATATIAVSMSVSCVSASVHCQCLHNYNCTLRPWLPRDAGGHHLGYTTHTNGNTLSNTITWHILELCPRQLPLPSLPRYTSRELWRLSLTLMFLKINESNKSYKTRQMP